jgi:hypothetical protein
MARGGVTSNPTVCELTLERCANVPTVERVSKSQKATKKIEKGAKPKQKEARLDGSSSRAGAAVVLD